MARFSYGGDMFSPVRCDNSLNEDSFLEGRSSDIFFGTWKDLSNDSCSIGKNEEKRHNSHKRTTNAKEDDSMKGKETTIDSNLFSKRRSNENLINTSSLKDLSQELELSKNKGSFITTRKSSLRNGTKTTEVHKVEAKNEKQANNDKQRLSQHVTMRSSSRKKSTHLTGNLKQNDKFSNASFPTLDEECIEKSSDLPKSNKDSLLEHLNRQHFIHTSVSPRVEGKDKQDVLIYNDDNHCKSKVTFSTVNCGSQTELLMSDVSPAINKDKHKLNVCVSPESNHFCSQKSSDPQQIQAGIIEKLVKDTVSFEFDSIRQMLYLQQLSLFKHLDRNADAMKQNSTDCGVLLKIIDELMEENQRLRKILANQSC